MIAIAALARVQLVRPRNAIRRLKAVVPTVI
jgi:hypothetical protein